MSTKLVSRDTSLVLARSCFAVAIYNTSSAERRFGFCYQALQVKWMQSFALRRWRLLTRDCFLHVQPGVSIVICARESCRVCPRARVQRTDHVGYSYWRATVDIFSAATNQKPFCKWRLKRQEICETNFEKGENQRLASASCVRCKLSKSDVSLVTLWRPGLGFTQELVRFFR